MRKVHAALKAVVRSVVAGDLMVAEPKEPENLE
jgi:hypothetical protein